MVFAAGLDGFCPVELFQYHDAGQMMGKGHGAHGKLEICFLLDSGGHAKGRADEKTGAALTGNFDFLQLLGKGFAGQGLALRCQDAEPGALGDLGQNQIRFLFEACGNLGWGGILGQTMLRQFQQMGCKIGVYAATTVGEETTMRGAHWAGSAVNPNVAIAVDVTYAQDYPGTDPNESGKVELGKGPVICNSSIANKKVNNLLKSIAKEKEIPYQMESFVGRTGTDADKIHFAGAGVVTALLSLPLRYMHSPSEVCDLKDVENSIELLANFLCTIDENTNIDPFQ